MLAVSLSSGLIPLPLAGGPLPGPFDFEVISSGHQSLEGPSVSPVDNEVFFVDQSAGALWSWSEATGAVLRLQYEGKINGTTFGPDGHLLLCESANRRITRIDPKASPLSPEPIVGDLPNEPNDIIVHSDGSLWFTTPYWGNDTQRLNNQHVYRYDPDDDSLEIIHTSRGKPNGLAFSPDESLLYVALYANNSIVRIPLDNAGQPSGSPSVLINNLSSGPDGMKVDPGGRLLVVLSGGDFAGLILISPEGEIEGLIRLPEDAAAPTNVALGGEHLILTAGTKLLRLPQSTLEGTGASFFRTPRNLNIDGLVDPEWLIADPLPVSHPIRLYDMRDPNDLFADRSDFHVEARMLWDATHLYAMVFVTDDAPQAPYTGTWFREDTVEFYIDADNSRLAAYDGLNDWEIGFHTLADPIALVLGPNAPAKPPSIEVAMRPSNPFSPFGDGYILEASMPWTELGLANPPGDGDFLGFDLHVVDNDNLSGQREHKLAWHTWRDEAWRMPRDFAPVELRAPPPDRLLPRLPAEWIIPAHADSLSGFWAYAPSEALDWIYLSIHWGNWVYSSSAGWAYILVAGPDSYWWWTPSMVNWAPLPRI